MRFLPISATCYAKLDEIKKVAERLAHPYFLEDDVKPAKVNNHAMTKFPDSYQTCRDTRLDRVSHASALFSHAHTPECLIHTPQAVRPALLSNSLFAFVSEHL